MKRLAIYLAATFAISWSCWWALAAMIPPGAGPATSHLFMALYLLGGFGPAIAAGIALGVTAQTGGATQYFDSLLRWRVHPIWWLAAFIVPIAFAALKERVAIQVGGGAVMAAPLEPLARAAILFPAMVLGGGLEELGWRGLAQPEIERRAPRLAATLIVGAIWALWHLPLFHIPGAPQYGRNLPLFATDVLANACLLAWLYGRTRSIPLCVTLHAASNTATAMGVLAIGSPVEAPAWIATGVKLTGALLLLIAGSARRREA